MFATDLIASQIPIIYLLEVASKPALEKPAVYQEADDPDGLLASIAVFPALFNYAIQTSRTNVRDLPSYGNKLSPFDRNDNSPQNFEKICESDQAVGVVRSVSRME